MTEDLIAMAVQSGFEVSADLAGLDRPDEPADSAYECSLGDKLRRFAALIEARAVARTREECALICEAGMDHSMEERMKSKSIQLNGADGELEALKFWSTVSLYNNARALCAAAIRALGERT